MCLRGDLVRQSGLPANRLVVQHGLYQSILLLVVKVLLLLAEQWLTVINFALLMNFARAVEVSGADVGEACGGVLLALDVVPHLLACLHVRHIFLLITDSNNGGFVLLSCNYNSNGNMESDNNGECFTRTDGKKAK